MSQYIPGVNREASTSGVIFKKVTACGPATAAECKVDPIVKTQKVKFKVRILSNFLRLVMVSYPI
jgi:hypothetical protein